jgi:Flp pilus assembly protein TadG
MRAPARGQLGSASVELVLITPVLVMFVLLVAMGGRMAQSRGHIDVAARDAARAASIERSPAAARAQGQASAAATLGQVGVPCQSVGVAVDTSDFRPGGTVAVEVSCAVRLSDLGLLGIPATRTMTSRSVAPVDVHRGVT